MHFINQYEMTRKRYDKWAVPKFWCLGIFYVYLAIFLVSGFAMIYFKQHDIAQRWITLAAFMMFIAIYRGICFKWMAADKSYRLTKQNVFKDKPWMCKVEVREGGVNISANSNKPAHLKWEKIIKFVEGTTYFDLVVETTMGEDKARLDKDSFTLGDAESFKQFMLEQHPEIPYSWAQKRWDC